MRAMLENAFQISKDNLSKLLCSHLPQICEKMTPKTARFFLQIVMGGQRRANPLWPPRGRGSGSAGPRSSPSGLRENAFFEHAFFENAFFENCIFEKCIFEKMHFSRLYQNEILQENTNSWLFRTDFHEDLSELHDILTTLHYMSENFQILTCRGRE